MGTTFLLSRKRVAIDSPHQQVFDYLSDMSRHGEWDREEGFTMTVLPSGPAVVGSVSQRERERKFPGAAGRWRTPRSVRFPWSRR